MTNYTLNLEAKWNNLLSQFGHHSRDSFVKELLATELYRRRVISANQAAELLNMTVSEFTQYATQMGIIVPSPQPMLNQSQAILRETFGMWADREDIPTDGVVYMDEIRSGQRLTNLGL